MNIDRSKTISIAKRYGFKEQSYQCIEECAELIHALNKYRRLKTKSVEPGDFELTAAQTNIIEEMADVSILIDQLTWLLKADDVVNGMVEYKQNRTISKMGGSE